MTDQQTQMAASLALALASVYVPNADKGLAAGQALVAALQMYREANGKPEGWVPSADEWNALIADREGKSIEALRAQAGLPPTPTA